MWLDAANLNIRNWLQDAGDFYQQSGAAYLSYESQADGGG
jgi:hypothetical protein